MEVHFTIEGEFVTNHFRDLVLEGDWRGAVDGLKSSLIGITDEYVYQILSGECKLTGVDDLVLEGDDKLNDLNWLKEYYFHYFYNVVQHNNKFYKPYGEVTHLNGRDLEICMEMNEYDTLPIDTGYDTNATLNLNMQRAETYLKNTGDIVIYHEADAKWILLRNVDIDYPIWVKGDIKKSIINMYMIECYDLDSYDLDDIKEIRKTSEFIRLSKERVSKMGNNIIETNSIINNFLKDEKEIDTINITELKERITTKADSLGGWLEVTNPLTDVSYKLPKHAFYRWCLSDSSAYSLVEWGAESPRGLKMGGDDPNHTDWWLFTELEFSLAHETNHPEVSFLYDLKSEYFNKLTNSNITPLAKGTHKGFDRAKVTHINSPTDKYIPENGIIIIPSASPEYEMILIEAGKKNSIVISQTGGKLCHLATVSREFDISLWMLPKAFEKLTVTSFVKFDTENYTIEILPMDMEQNIKLKMSGYLYK